MKMFVLCLLLQLACVCDGAKFVLFNITQGEPYTEGIRCVLKSLNTSCKAFKIRDADGKCLLLPQSWAANKTYSTGHTYLKEIVEPVFQSFVRPDEIGEENPLDDKERMWTIRGSFRIGSRMDLYFSTDVPEWNAIVFRFFNTSIGSPFDADFSGLLFVSITLSEQKDEVRFKTYSGVWTSANTWSTFPNQDTYKMTIVAQQVDFQILFDGIERARLTYVGPPETMTKMGVKFNHERNVHINNVTLYAEC